MSQPERKDRRQDLRANRPESGAGCQRELWHSLSGGPAHGQAYHGDRELPARPAGNIRQRQEKDDHFWHSVLRQCLLESLVYKDIEQYGLIRLTDAGRKFNDKPKNIKLSINHDYEAEAADVQVEGSGGKSVLDQTLFSMLVKIRESVAKEQKLPPYVIFSESSLEEMATTYPCNLEELSKIGGVSAGKANKYGVKFAAAIKKYVEENEIERPGDFSTMKQVANKSVHKIHIIQNIDKKLPLDEIACNRGMKMIELIDEISSIVTSGTKLNLDYYLNDIIEEDLQDEVMDFFREMESGDLKEAFNELKDEGLSY